MAGGRFRLKITGLAVNLVRWCRELRLTLLRVLLFPFSLAALIFGPDLVSLDGRCLSRLLVSLNLDAIGYSCFCLGLHFAHGYLGWD